jgi:hypothetical protein
MDWLDRAGDYGVAISVKRDKNTQKNGKRERGKGKKRKRHIISIWVSMNAFPEQ